MFKLADSTASHPSSYDEWVANDDAWKRLRDKLDTRASPPTYDEMVELARLSPDLRLAFEGDELTQLNYDKALHFHARDIAETHGYRMSSQEPVFKPTEQTFKAFVEAAKVDRFHFDALKRATAWLIGEGIPLDANIAWWVRDYMLDRTEPPPRKRGPDEFKNRQRDFHIVWFLRQIEVLNGRITENDATATGETACDAVVEAWGGKYDVPEAKRLMNIWSERERR
ncbi:MAG: hypothetical protein R3D59_04155 [Paracoccaceae bacterium]